MKIYNEVFNLVDARSISKSERSKLDLLGSNRTEFTYGECIYEYLVPFLKLAEPKPGEIFYDIGCGSAKPVALAALEFPDLKICKGVELL